MRRILWTMAVATLAAPAAARAFEWNGRIGVLYGRGDQWTPAGDRLTEPRLDLDLALDAAGYLYSPNAVDYSGGVQYRRLSTAPGSVSHVDDELSYRLRSTIFGDPNSPLRLDLSATRVDDGSTQGGDSLGNLRSRSYGASALVAVPDRPSLQVGYAYDEVKRDLVLIGESDHTLQSVTANTRHGAAGFSYNARYQGNFSEGTYASDNYDDHTVDVDGSADLTERLGLQLTERYFLRLPRLDSQFNPRQETNSLFANLRNGTGSDPSVSRVSYAYTHAVQTAPLLEDVERTANRAEYGVQRTVSPEWRFHLNASASFSDDRLGTVRERNAGQDVSGVAYWRRTSGDDYLELRGGPTLGVLEPEGGSATFAYGTTAGAAVLQSWSLLRTNLSYDVTYASDLNGQRGWSLRQQAAANADRPVGTGFLRAQLLLSSERHETRLFGAGASRSLTGTLDYRWGSQNVQVQAGLSDGVAGNVAGGGDGLFLPAPYNTHVRHVALTGSTLVTKRIVITGRASYSSTDLPDRPALSEGELFASADLIYGALRIGVEDRYAIAETPIGTARINQVLLRLYRTFGSR